MCCRNNLNVCAQPSGWWNRDVCMRQAGSWDILLQFLHLDEHLLGQQTSKKMWLNEETITTFMRGQQFWTISKRTTNQAWFLRLQKQKQVTSRDPGSQHLRGAWGRADHLSFLPAISKGISSPPFLGGAGAHTSFSVSPYCSKGPNEAFLEIPLWSHNYFYWLKSPRIQVENM